MSNEFPVSLLQETYPQYTWTKQEDIAFDCDLATARLCEMRDTLAAYKERCAVFMTGNNRFMASSALIANMKNVERMIADNIATYEGQLGALRLVIDKDVAVLDEASVFQQAFYELEYLYTDTVAALGAYDPFYRYAPAGDQSRHAYHGSEDDLFLRYHAATPQRPITEYRRNGTTELKQFEKRLAVALGVDTERYALVAMSSACAAFSTLLAYLKHRAKSKGVLKVLMSESGYSEFLEIVRHDPGLVLVHYPNKDVADPTQACIEACHRERPDIVLLESVSNHLQNRFIDIKKIVSACAGMDGLTIVCDDTLAPTAYPDLMDGCNGIVDVFRITSGCKYLNMGMDRVSCGFLTMAKEHEAALSTEWRTLLGTTLYQDAARHFPTDFSMLSARNARIERNAVLFCILFNAAMNGTGLRASHPRLVDHPDAVAVGQADVFTGGLVTIGYADNKIDDDVVFTVCRAAIRNAEKAKVDMVLGTSFGHSAPRIWPCRLPADAQGIRYRYFRYYAGARSIEDVAKAAAAVAEAMREHLDAGRSISTQAA